MKDLKLSTGLQWSRLLQESRVLAILWTQLDASSRRRLYFTSRGVQRCALTIIESITLFLPLEPQLAHEVASLTFLPRDAANIIHEGVALKLRPPEKMLCYVPPGTLSNVLLVSVLMRLNNRPGGSIMPRVHHLEIYSAYIDEFVGAANDYSQLVSLRLCNTDVNISFFNSAVLKGIRHLEVERAFNTHWTKLSDNLQMVNLQKLELYGNDIVFNQEDVEKLAKSSPNLHSMLMMFGWFKSGAVEALLKLLPHVKELDVEGLQPLGNLTQWECSWKDLKLRGAIMPRDLANIPLRSLEKPLYQDSYHDFILAIDEHTSVDEVEAALDNILTCPALSSSICLNLVPTTETAMRPEHIHPMKKLKSHIRSVLLQADNIPTCLVSVLDEVLGNELEVIECLVTQERGTANYLFENPSSFPSLRQMTLIDKSICNHWLEGDNLKLLTLKRPELQEVAISFTYAAKFKLAQVHAPFWREILGEKVKLEIYMQD